ARAAARRHHAELQKELHAWLVTDRARRVQRVMGEGWGDTDPAATQVLHWLRARQGMRVHVRYASVDAGVEVRSEGDWMAGPPTIFRDHRTGNPEVTWTVPGPARAIELPARTYHEVEVLAGHLVYRRRAGGCARPPALAAAP